MLWILPLLLIALGMIACLGLFLSLKADLQVQARRGEKRVESMLVRLQEAAGPPERPSESRALDEAPAVVYVPLRSGINISRRTEALRLLRRGEDVSHVAAALGVPRREIELLIRVQELVAHRAAETWPAAPRSPAAKAAVKSA
jgi:hypothetical protein